MGEYHVIETLIPSVMESLQRIEASLSVRAPSRPGEVIFTAQGVQPPTQFYVTQDFQIRVRSVTSQTAEVLTVTANILVDNRVVPVSTSSPAFTNAVNTTTLRVSATGFLVSCSLQATVATLRCQTYAVVELLDQNGTFQNTLFAGYVTTVKPLAYPPITIEDSFSGYGITTRNIILPGVGVTDATHTVPVNRIWDISAILVQGTASAVAGNRDIKTSYVIGANTIYTLQPLSTFVFAASQNATYLFHVGSDSRINTGTLAPTLDYNVPGKRQTALPGHVIWNIIGTPQAGDRMNFSAVIYEEFLTL